MRSLTLPRLVLGLMVALMVMLSLPTLADAATPDAPPTAGTYPNPTISMEGFPIEVAQGLVEYADFTADAPILANATTLYSPDWVIVEDLTPEEIGILWGLGFRGTDSDRCDCVYAPRLLVRGITV